MYTILSWQWWIQDLPKRGRGGGEPWRVCGVQSYNWGLGAEPPGPVTEPLVGIEGGDKALPEAESFLSFFIQKGLKVKD